MRKISNHMPATGRAMFAVTPQPERLVLFGYRCWQAGFVTGDIACWEVAWNEFARILGPRHAKPALGELAAWVRCMRETACRTVEVYPHACRRVAADEVQAICMIGACQAGRCPLARAMAFELLASNDIDGVVSASADFAAALARAGQLLSWNQAPVRNAGAMPGSIH